jgi:integrase
MSVHRGEQIAERQSYSLLNELKLKNRRASLYFLNKFTDKLCKKAKVPPFKLHQLRHLATAILKDEADMSLAKLQRFLRHDHQKTTEIYAGHIETGTKKQTDFLADFWTDKLELIQGHESIPETINQEN